MSRELLIPIAFVLGFAVVVPARLTGAATYYVDFDGGSDDNDGLSTDKPWQHCPGDGQAKGKAQAVQLAGGDEVIFKGGVRYRGEIHVAHSGQKGRPIVFDGNTKGAFGAGRAVIDGGTPVTGWKPCESAQQARGNPRWREILVAAVPKPREWNGLNLCDEDGPLPVAQDPNPADPFFQERISEFHRVDQEVAYDCPAKVYPEKGTKVNPDRPLILTIARNAGSAVVEPIPGAAFTVELPRPVRVTAVGIEPQGGYAPVKEVAFLGDGNELAKVSLKKDPKDLQKFDLPAPATFGKLTVKFLSMQEGESRNWTAIKKVAAYAPDGTDVLAFDVGMSWADPNVLSQRDPHYYDGMMLGLHCGNNMVEYLKVLKYDPSQGRLWTGLFPGRLYKQTRYSLYNSVRLIDRPGEYSLEPTEDPKTWRLFLLPPKPGEASPAGIAYSQYTVGFSLEKASHVEVRGFVIQRQTRSAGLIARDGADVVFRDCEVRLVRAGTAIAGTKVDGMLIERCFVHHNPGHTKGIVLHTCSNSTVQRCKLVKNTSTGLDYYICTHSKILHNEVTEHYGMHANALTLYLGCKDCEVAYNKVFRSNIGLTIQEAENVVIHHNLFDGNNESMCVGIWVATPFKNVRFLNNTLVRSAPNHSWIAAVFSNNRGPEGLVFRNNIIDGLSGNLPAQYGHNIYTQWGPNQREKKALAEGELYQPDLGKLFVDPAKGDWRLRAGSPAIDAGQDVGLSEDLAGTKVPQGKAPDVGAYEYAPER